MGGINFREVLVSLALIGLTMQGTLNIFNRYTNWKETATKKEVYFQNVDLSKVNPDFNVVPIKDWFLEPDGFYLLRVAADNISAQLNADGIDPNKVLDSKELESLAFSMQGSDEMKRELNIEEAYLAPIQVVENLSTNGNFDGRNINIKSGLTRITAVDAYAHEDVHSQKLAVPTGRLYFDWVYGNPYNETFAQVARLEILANRALNGDLLARLYVLQDISKMSAVLAVTNPDESYEKYFSMPSQIVVDALNDRREEYGRVKLDGIVELVNEEVSRMKTRQNEGNLERVSTVIMQLPCGGYYDKSGYETDNFRIVRVSVGNGNSDNQLIGIVSLQGATPQIIASLPELLCETKNN